MSIQIFNTLKREKEPFKPLKDGEVKMYVCGPTVYNYIHIGNARPIIVFDTVRRYFTYRGYDVKFVSNFTDVDDKLIRAANELKLTVPEVADRFIGAYFDDVDQLNVAKATVNPRVTENMDEIIQLISTLIEKGYAYESAGDVYFRTKKFKDYGNYLAKNYRNCSTGLGLNIMSVSKMNLISPFGKRLNRVKFSGKVRLVMGARVGILNARRLRKNILVTRLIFMRVGKI